MTTMVTTSPTFLTVFVKSRYAFSRTVTSRAVCSVNDVSERCQKQKWHQYGQSVRNSHQFSKTYSHNCGKHQLHQKLPKTVRGITINHTSKHFENPLSELQKYVSVPIFTEEQAVFHPSRTEMNEAVKIFHGPEGSNVKNPAKFVGSYADGSQVPDLNLPEVCFLGRSNVGKSSLIQALLSTQPKINVRVSKKPGHTKTVNLFRMGRQLTLVDMPGYGYNMPRNFQQSVESYLQGSRRLCRTFLLVDAEVGLVSTDTIALDMLREFGIPFVVVLTKLDKASRYKLLQNVLAVMKTCQESGGHGYFSQPFLVSSKTGDGLIFLQTFIAYITGCIAVKGL